MSLVQVQRWAPRAGLIILACCLLTTVSAGTRPDAASAGPAGPPDLFHIGSATALGQVVQWHDGVLRPVADSAVRLPLGHGARTARLRPAEPVAGYDHWAGSLDGEPDSTVTVIQKGKQVNALVSGSDGTYRISTTDSGQRTLLRADTSRSDADLVLTPPHSASTTAPRTAPVGPMDGPTTVDVLVAYTSGAQAQAGGASAVRSLAAMSVAVTNDALTASAVHLRFALVGTVATSGASSDPSSPTLRQLAAVGDGSHDEVHAARDATGADLVSLLTKGDSGSLCGIAYYPGGDEYGFSVVNALCAVDNLSFAHELGHNLGAAHDRYVDATPYYPDAHGYVDASHRWRTIMAYADSCTAAGAYCPKIGRFSNPERDFGGLPTGVASGQVDSADNRIALNALAPTAAAYRASVSTVPAAPTGLQVSASPATHQATLQWEGAADGGSAITGWVVSRNGTSDTGGGAFTSKVQPASSRSFTFNRLVPGQTYTFTLHAINALGAGSPTNLDVLLAVAPGAPRIGRATPGAPGGAVTASVAWNAPLDDGGSAVTSYAVTAWRVANGAVVQKTTSPALAASARNYRFPLPRTGNWQFVVRATSTAGQGPPSAASNVVAAR